MKRRSDGLYEKKITIQGKRVTFYGKSMREVNQKILHYEEEKEKGPLFCEVAEAWQEEHFPTLAYNTQQGYFGAYHRVLRQYGKRNLQEISVREIDEFLLKLGQQGFAQKTVKNHQLILNLIFKYAVSQEYIPFNIIMNTSMPKNLKKTKRELPSSEEIEKVKKGLSCTYGLFAYFLLYTGCRRGEALALQYQDIDFEHKLIHIRKSLYHDGSEPKIKLPKTEAGCRDIILLDRLAEKIPHGKPEHYIFSEGGILMPRKRYETLWKQYCRESGVTVTPHQLRHAYATILFEAGVDEKDAQELLGHSTIAMTRDIYTHISSKRKQKTAELLNQFDG